MAVVLDTSVLYAALDAADPDHARCALLVGERSEELVVPGPVLVELEHLLRGRRSPDAWLRFAEDLAEGRYTLYAAHPALVLRAARLQRKYADLPIGFVDAAVFVSCEELGERKVATLDHRHFSVLRTKDRRQLTLLPA